MEPFTLALPPDFDDYEGETEAKGYFPEARLSVAGKHYRLTFYDPVRLSQTIADDLRHGALFFEANLVVVSAVTRSEMERAVEALIKTQLANLIAE